MSEETCRIDVWLWRARFLKTRALAAKFVEDGRVRLERPGLGPPARLLGRVRRQRLPRDVVPRAGRPLSR